MKDKAGKNLKIGDWVYYPWWDDVTARYNYFCGKIRDLNEKEDAIYVHPAYGMSTPGLVRKLPANKKLHEQTLLLWKLEGLI